MTERQDELLNRFVDGVLSETEKIEFDAMTESNPELASLKEDFLNLGHLLRADIEEEISQVDFTGFAAQVNARIDSEGVVMMSPADDVNPMVSTNAESLPNGSQGLFSWWNAQWKPLLLGAAAAAAVAFMVVGLDSDEDKAEGGQRGPAIAGQASPSAPSAEGTNPVSPREGTESKVLNQETASGNVVIDSVSFEGPRTVLVSMPLQEGEDTVIWLLDDEENLEPVEGEDPI